jgi:hypothetical protein
MEPTNMAPALARSDLRLLPGDWRAAAIAVALSVAVVTAFIVVLDCFLFRAHLPDSYVSFFTGPLTPRLQVICVLAAYEEVKYRLLLMTALCVAVAVLWKRTPPGWCFVLIIIAAQFANVGGYILSHSDPAYNSLRYLAVGSVWGWLYWKHGWLSALVGHSSTHIFLDPLLLRAL